MRRSRRGAMPAMAAQGMPVRGTAGAWSWRLVLARGVRLPRRHMGARRRVRPDRLRHPRGLRAAAEAQEPSEESGAVLLKRRQDGFGSEGDLYVHGLMHSVRVLTDGSGETASTPKIVSDVARKPLVRSGLSGWLRHQ